MTNRDAEAGHQRPAMAQRSSPLTSCARCSRGPAQSAGHRSDHRQPDVRPRSRHQVSSRLRILPVAVIGSASTELDDARVLVAAICSLPQATSSSSVIVAPSAADDERLDLLAVALVRHADDRGQRDRLVGDQHLLDLARVHVEAAADDHVLGAVDDVVEAVLVAAGQVAGAEPAVAHHLGGRLGPVVVALHDVVAADRDLADLVGALDGVPVVVDQLAPRRPRSGMPIEPGRGSRSGSVNVATGEVSDSP